MILGNYGYKLFSTTVTSFLATAVIIISDVFAS